MFVWMGIEIFSLCHLVLRLYAFFATSTKSKTLELPIFVWETSRGLAAMSVIYGLCEELLIFRKHTAESKQATCNGRRVINLWHFEHLLWITWILYDITRFQVPTELIRWISLLKVSIRNLCERKRERVLEATEMFTCCAHAMQTSVSKYLWCMQHIQRQFLCSVLYNIPLLSQPRSARLSPWRRDYPLPCLSEAGRGSQHGVSQPALPGPAPTASKALLFRLSQRGFSYWTRGQFIPATLPRQNDFSQCNVDSRSQGPNEVKWMPVRPMLQEQFSVRKQHLSSSSTSGK